RNMLLRRTPVEPRKRQLSAAQETNNLLLTPRPFSPESSPLPGFLFHTRITAVRLQECIWELAMAQANLLGSVNAGWCSYQTAGVDGGRLILGTADAEHAFADEAIDIAPDLRVVAMRVEFGLD